MAYDGSMLGVRWRRSARAYMAAKLMGNLGKWSYANHAILLATEKDVAGS